MKLHTNYFIGPKQALPPDYHQKVAIVVPAIFGVLIVAFVAAYFFHIRGNHDYCNKPCGPDCRTQPPSVELDRIKSGSVSTQNSCEHDEQKTSRRESCEHGTQRDGTVRDVVEPPETKDVTANSNDGRKIEFRNETVCDGKAHAK